MLFDINSSEQGDWFAFFDSHFDQLTGETRYDPPEEGGAEFRIRAMQPFFDERRKTRKKENKMVVNPRTGAMERVTYYADLTPDEEQKEAEDAWDYAITGMKNARAGDGTIIECTRENKLKLVAIPKFQRFAKRVFEILNGEAVKVIEAEVENLSRGQTGT